MTAHSPTPPRPTAILLATLLWPLASATAAETLPPRWRIIPQVDLAATYDSNIDRAPDGEADDVFIEPELSLRYLSTTETNRWNARALAFAATRAYASEDDRDFSSFGQALELCVGDAEPTRVSLLQAFRRVEDIDRHAPESAYIERTGDLMQDINSQSARRDLLDIALIGERRLSEKSEARLAYQYDRTAYDEDRLLDLASHLVQAEAAYQWTARSAIYADVRYGMQEQTDGPGSADVFKGRLGLRTRGTDTVVGRIGVGLQHYAWETGDDDASEDTPSLDTSLTWQMTEKLLGHAGVNNGSQLSSAYDDNALDYMSGWMGVAFAWTDFTTIGLRALYRRDDYLDPVLEAGAPRDRRDERYHLVARLDYRAPSRAWGLYGQATQERVVSSIDSAEYDDTRLTVGSHIAF